MTWEGNQESECGDQFSYHDSSRLFEPPEGSILLVRSRWQTIEQPARFAKDISKPLDRGFVWATIER